MAKNITRRQAAKAISLGTAAAFVAPVALADGNPDTDILALARELERIETVVIPPLEKTQAKAEAMANGIVKAWQDPPRKTLDQIENQQAEMLATARGDGIRSKLLQEVLNERHPGVDIENAVSLHFAPDREAVQEYEDWRAERIQAENETGLFKAEQELARADGEAEAIREKICAMPARTDAGYRIKLKIAMDGKHPDTLADPEYITDKALVSLMRDLEART